MKLVTALMVGVRPCTCRHWLRSACQRYVRENVRPDDPPAAGRLVAQPVHHVPGQTVWAVGSCGQQRRDQPPARIRGARRWQPRPRRRPNVRQCVLPPSPLHVPHSHAGGGVGWVHARLCRSLGGARCSSVPQVRPSPRSSTPRIALRRGRWSISPLRRTTQACACTAPGGRPSQARACNSAPRTGACTASWA
jgi:hypothetical protein